MKFIDTEETLGFEKHSDDAYFKLFLWVCCVEMPDWLPAPLEGYEYYHLDNITYMRPKPKLRHILRYKFIPNWWRKLRAKIWVKNMFKELRKT